MKALLCLEDSVTFEGESVGASGVVTGEVVFNTGMTGYQEILTDPSYAGQIVTLTYPLVGNYGTNAEDFQSTQIQVAGFVVRQAAFDASNWRSKETLPAFLTDRGVVAISGIDTRALTRLLRSQGVMMGGIGAGVTREELLERVRTAPAYTSRDYVQSCSTPSAYLWTGKPEPVALDALRDMRPRVAVLDLGVKYNILEQLRASGVDPIVFPCTTSAEEILKINPAGVVLTPGPGDPARLDYVVRTTRDLLGKRPLFGICLGHQALAHALGGQTFKLKFGHRGSNHPVRDLETGRVYITSQNHGFAVDPAGLEESGAVVTQININDGTVEGLRLRDADAFSIQYHPEASPGPSDSSYLFQEFVERLHR